MPWRCPACGIPIHHSDAETVPRRGVRYRCHVCRLELVVDPHDEKLTVPAVDDEPRAADKP
jgi:rubredoxin